MKKPRKPDAFEQGVLDVVLVEIRRAIRAKSQLSVTIDPFVSTCGAHISAYSNERGLVCYETDAAGVRMR